MTREDEIITVTEYKDCYVNVKLDVITISSKDMNVLATATIERKHKYAFIRYAGYLTPVKLDKHESSYTIAFAFVDYLKATNNVLD